MRGDALRFERFHAIQLPKKTWYDHDLQPFGMTQIVCRPLHLARHYSTYATNSDLSSPSYHELWTLTKRNA